VGQEPALPRHDRDSAAFYRTPFNENGEPYAVPRFLTFFSPWRRSGSVAIGTHRKSGVDILFSNLRPAE
jgi:hypothetical protein